jgi:hypothetical protein
MVEGSLAAVLEPQSTLKTTPDFAFGSGNS